MSKQSNIEIIEQISSTDLNKINMLIDEIRKSQSDKVSLKEIKEIQRLIREKIFTEIELSVSLKKKIDIDKIISRIRFDNKEIINFDEKDEIIYSFKLPFISNIGHQQHPPKTNGEFSDILQHEQKNNFYLKNIVIITTILSVISFHPIFGLIQIIPYLFFSLISYFKVSQVNSKWLKYNIYMILNGFLFAMIFSFYTYFDEMMFSLVFIGMPSLFLTMTWKFIKYIDSLKKFPLDTTHDKKDKKLIRYDLTSKIIYTLIISTIASIVTGMLLMAQFYFFSDGFDVLVIIEAVIAFIVVRWIWLTSFHSFDRKIEPWQYRRTKNLQAQSNNSNLSDIDKANMETLRYLLPILIVSTILSFTLFSDIYVILLMGVYSVFVLVNLVKISRVTSLWMKFNILMMLNTIFAVSAIRFYTNSDDIYFSLIFFVVPLLVLSITWKLLNYQNEINLVQKNYKTRATSQIIILTLAIAGFISIIIDTLLFLQFYVIFPEMYFMPNYGLFFLEIILLGLILLFLFFKQFSSIEQPIISSYTKIEQPHINSLNSAGGPVSQASNIVNEIPQDNYVVVRINKNKVKKYFKYHSGVFIWVSHLLLLITIISISIQFYIEITSSYSSSYEIYPFNIVLIGDELTILALITANISSILWVLILSVKGIIWFSRRQKKIILNHILLLEGTIPRSILIKPPKNMDTNSYTQKLSDLIMHNLISIINLGGQ